MQTSAARWWIVCTFTFLLHAGALIICICLPLQVLRHSGAVLTDQYIYIFLLHADAQMQTFAACWCIVCIFFFFVAHWCINYLYRYNYCGTLVNCLHIHFFLLHVGAFVICIHLPLQLCQVFSRHANVFDNLFISTLFKRQVDYI